MNREPPKKESAFGNTILWYLLCSQATPSPTMMPPKSTPPMPRLTPRRRM